MAEPQQIPLQIDTALFSLTNLTSGFDEEQFVFTLFSGNSARRYSLSPKHAKRVFLLLEAQVRDYEKKFGTLKTDLPKPQEGSRAEEHEMGFK